MGSELRVACGVVAVLAVIFLAVLFHRLTTGGPPSVSIPTIETSDHDDPGPKPVVQPTIVRGANDEADNPRPRTVDDEQVANPRDVLPVADALDPLIHPRR